MYKVTIEQNIDIPNVDSCVFKFDSWSDAIDFMGTCMDNSVQKTRIIFEQEDDGY